MSGDFFTTLARRAAARYPVGDAYGRHFAFMKLTRDPLYRHVVATGLMAPRSRLLDAGCGQGLLESLLDECRAAHEQGEWPRDWAAAPVGCSVRGIDLDERNIERARRAAPGARFERADLRIVPLGRCDAVTIFDVLHYIPVQDQRAVLARVRACLDRGGVLLLRVADRGRRLRFAFTLALDWASTGLRGLGWARQHCRPLASWRADLEALGFDVTPVPMWRGTGFANVLLVARL